MKLSLSALLIVVSLRAQVTYSVTLPSGEIRKLSSEDYVTAVLAGEAATFRSPEALRAMAIAARTYATQSRGRHAAEGFDFCTTTHCQQAIFERVAQELRAAAEATAGELLWFQGRPAFAVYSQNCGGRSEAVDVVWDHMAAPYLRVHDDPYCVRRGRFTWQWRATPEQFATVLQSQGPVEHAEVVSRQPSGRARLLRFRGPAISRDVNASTFRFAVGRSLGWNLLRSDWYEVDTGTLTFHGYGRGHGVGLCQDGTEQMGREGATYREILRFYYPGTSVGRLASGTEWTRLGSERLALLSVQPAHDRTLLPVAEAQLNWCERRTHLRFIKRVEIRVYRDTAAFRDATGEPGWVAAHAVGHRIDIQPAAANPETLRHELLHVLITEQAVPGLPEWFREGIVEYLTNERGPRPLAPAGNLRDRTDESIARHGYAQAGRRVGQLVAHYGEVTVLGWTGRGLPEEVTNSTDSNPQTNSR